MQDLQVDIFQVQGRLAEWVAQVSKRTQRT